MADARRLAELSMPTELAKEVARQIEAGGGGGGGGITNIVAGDGITVTIDGGVATVRIADTLRTRVNNSISNITNGPGITSSLGASSDTSRAATIGFNATGTSNANNVLHGGDAGATVWGPVATGNISDQAITAAKIANTTITAAQLANNAVSADKLNAQAVTLPKIAHGGTAGQVLTSGGADADVSWTNKTQGD